MKEIILKELEKNPYVTGVELSKILGVSTCTALRHRKKYSNITMSECISRRNTKHSTDPKINISEEADQIIIGSLLGDGCIIKNHNCLFTILHSKAQEDYCRYKYDLLTNAGIKSRFSYEPGSESKINGRKITNNGKVRIKSCQNQSFNIYREEWYSDKKRISNAVYRLKPIGLAIWFMDDGSKNASSYYISTNGFDYEDQKILIDMLYSNFGIEAAIHKNKDKYVLYIKAKSRELFTNIIKPYICDSMKYKLYK